jgi:hypothetical protein
MPSNQWSAYWPLRVGLLGSNFVCLLILGSIWRWYPVLFVPTATSVTLLLLCVGVIAGSSILTIWGIRPHTPAQHIAIQGGLHWGGVLSLLWTIEVLSGNLVAAPPLGVRLVYYSAAACAFGTPILAGFYGARQTRRVRTGASIGVWSGLLSGSWIFMLLMLLTLGGVNHGLPVDAKDIAQFQHSGAPDLTTFLIGEALTGAIVHLAVIGPVWGGMMGALGGVLGAVLATEPAPSPPPRP